MNTDLYVHTIGFSCSHALLENTTELPALKQASYRPAQPKLILDIFIRLHRTGGKYPVYCLDAYVHHQWPQLFPESFINYNIPTTGQSTIMLLIFRQCSVFICRKRIGVHESSHSESLCKKTWQCFNWKCWLLLREANMTVTLATTTKKELKNESQIPTVIEYKIVICKLTLLLTEMVLL